MGRFDQYVGLPWKHSGIDRDGVNCWGLMCLVQRECFGREIPRLVQGDTVGLLEIMVTVQVEKIPLEAAQAGDVLLMRGSFENEENALKHIGVFVDPHRVLHILEGQTSQIDDIRRDAFKWRPIQAYRLAEGEGPIPEEWCETGAAVPVAQAAATFFNLAVSYKTLSLGGALVASALLWDGRALLDRVFFGKKKDDGRPRRDLDPRTQNTANPGGSVPIVLGERRYTPYLAALPSVEEVAGDEFINIALCWGHASVSLRDIRFGAQLSTTYEHKQTDDLDGNGDLDWLPRVDDIKLDFDLGTDWITRRTVTRADYITLHIDSSLYAYTTQTEQRGRDEIPYQAPDFPNYGPPGSPSVGGGAGGGGTSYELTHYTYYSNWRDIEINYRKVGNNPWITKTARIEGDTYITLDKGADSNSPNGRAPLERAEYEVRIRVTASGNDAPEGASIGGGIKLTGIKSRLLEVPVSGGGVSLSLFRVKVTEETGEVVYEINAIVGTKMPLRQSDGTWPDISTDAYKSDSAKYGVSKNPADIFRFVMTGKEINESPLPVTSIDDANLNEWWQYCDAQGMGYSKVIEGDETRQEVIGEVAKAGLAYPRLVDGKWGVAINRPVDTPTQLFTPRNSWNFRQQIDMPRLPHALRVAFANETKDWEADERIVYDDGFAESAGDGNAEATHVEDLNVPGVTNSDAAYKIARHVLAASRLRPYVVTFDVDFEYLCSDIGDRVQVQHDVALIGQTSGRVADVSGDTITLDNQVTFETGKPYSLVVRKSNREIVSIPVSGQGSTYAVTARNASGVRAGDLFAFGETDKAVHDMIVENIAPRRGNNATVTLIPYAPAVYTAADNIPAWESNISDPVGPTGTGPPPPVITSIVSDESALPITLTGTPIPMMRVDFEPTAADPLNANVRLPKRALVEYRITGADKWNVEEVQAENGRAWLQQVVVGEIYEVRVRYTDIHQRASDWSVTALHTVIGLTAPPKDVDALQIDNSGDTTVLEWVYFNPPRDVVGFQIRYASDDGVRNWDRMRQVGPLVPANARTLAVPSASGTYAIKAIDAGGRVSVSAIYRDDEVGPLTAFKNVATLDESAVGANGQNFEGTKSGVEVRNLTLQLERNDDGTEILENSGSYTTAIEDLGGIYSVDVLLEGTVDAAESLSNTMAAIESMANPETMAGSVGDAQTQVEIEVRSAKTAAERNAWTDADWDALSTRQGVKARYVQFRATLVTDSDQVTPIVSTLVFRIRAAARVEHGTAASVTSGAQRITFGKSFEGDAPEISLQIANPQAGDYTAIDSATAARFDFSVRNSSGNRVARNVNWIAYGYGRKD